MSMGDLERLIRVRAVGSAENIQDVVIEQIRQVRAAIENLNVVAHEASAPPQEIIASYQQLARELTALNRLYRESGAEQRQEAIETARVVAETSRQGAAAQREAQAAIARVTTERQREATDAVRQAAREQTDVARQLAQETQSLARESVRVQETVSRAGSRAHRESAAAAVEAAKTASDGAKQTVDAYKGVESATEAKISAEGRAARAASEVARANQEFASALSSLQAIEERGNATTEQRAVAVDRLNKASKAVSAAEVEQANAAANLTQKTNDLATAEANAQALMGKAATAHQSAIQAQIQGVDKLAERQQKLAAVTRTVYFAMQGVEDLAYGFSAVVNNIPLVAVNAAQAMGASGTAAMGWAAALSGIGIAIDRIVIPAFERMLDKDPALNAFFRKLGEELNPFHVNSYTRAIDELEKHLKELESKKFKTSIDYRDIEIAKEKIEAAHRAWSDWQAEMQTKSEKEQERGKAIADILRNVAGGQPALERQLQQQIQRESEVADPRLSDHRRFRADVLDEVRNMAATMFRPGSPESRLATAGDLEVEQAIQADAGRLPGMRRFGEAFDKLKEANDAIKTRLGEIEASTKGMAGHLTAEAKRGGRPEQDELLDRLRRLGTPVAVKAAADIERDLKNVDTKLEPGHRGGFAGAEKMAAEMAADPQYKLFAQKLQTEIDDLKKAGKLQRELNSEGDKLVERMEEHKREVKERIAATARADEESEVKQIAARTQTAMKHEIERITAEGIKAKKEFAEIEAEIEAAARRVMEGAEEDPARIGAAAAEVARTGQHVARDKILSAAPGQPPAAAGEAFLADMKDKAEKAAKREADRQKREADRPIHEAFAGLGGQHTAAIQAEISANRLRRLQFETEFPTEPARQQARQQMARARSQKLDELRADQPQLGAVTPEGHVINRADIEIYARRAQAILDSMDAPRSDEEERRFVISRLVRMFSGARDKRGNLLTPEQIRRMAELAVTNAEHALLNHEILGQEQGLSPVEAEVQAFGDLQARQAQEARRRQRQAQPGGGAAGGPAGGQAPRPPRRGDHHGQQAALDLDRTPVTGRGGGLQSMIAGAMLGAVPTPEPTVGSDLPDVFPQEDEPGGGMGGGSGDEANAERSPQEHVPMSDLQRLNMMNDAFGLPEFKGSNAQARQILRARSVRFRQQEAQRKRIERAKVAHAADVAAHKRDVAPVRQPGIARGPTHVDFATGREAAAQQAIGAQEGREAFQAMGSDPVQMGMARTMGESRQDTGRLIAITAGVQNMLASVQREQARQREFIRMLENKNRDLRQTPQNYGSRSG
jgi:hypothetical protein